MKALISVLFVVAIVVVVWRFNQPNQPLATEDTSIVTISRQDILDATDFTAGVKLAVKNHDNELLDSWMAKAYDVAKQANLSAKDLAYMGSEWAKGYVVFRAKRSLFNDEFEHYYYQLLPIAELKAKYPEAEDLFPKVDQLIAQRDDIINTIANEIDIADADKTTRLSYAKEIWHERFGQNSLDLNAPGPSQP
jgi:hypothetical protein